MKGYLFIVLLFTFSFSFSQIQYIENDLKTLSHDSMQGRLVGSESEKKCAQYLSNSFKTIGLSPLNDETFFQNFETKYNLNPHDTLNHKFKIITSQNVVGFLDNKAKKTVVIAAHYDHIGRNEYGQSMELKSKNQIHNGADDNASGVAGVLELARVFVSNGLQENVNFIFACFSGEEIGLIGSQKFVENIQDDLKINLMINMDMVGRLDSIKRLYIGGVGTCPLFNTAITKNKPLDFNLIIDSSGVGPSDHTTFYNRNIPVLFFHTGSHEDYHKTSDDADKINYSGLNEVLRYIQNIVFSLSSEKELTFTPTKNNSKTNKSTFKVTLGIMPNYASFEDGLHIDNVIEDRPAFKAGIIRGDVIVQINECKISDIYSYMDCLSALNKGDIIKVKLLRNESVILKEVNL